jgi:hypothetical protein
MRIVVASALVALLSTSAFADEAPPVITHTPVTTASGSWVQVMAKITSKRKFFPQVFYRYDAGGQWQAPIDMKPVRGEAHMFGANVPTRGALVEYYIEAYDEVGNGPARAGTPDAPIRVSVGAQQPAATAEAAPSGSQPAWGSAPAANPSANPNPNVNAPATRPAAPAAATTRVQQQSAGPTRVWTWAVGGTGLGLLVGGLMAGLAAKTAGNAYNDRLKDPQNNPVTLQSQYDAANGMGSKATILTIAGAALLAGGTFLYFYEPGMNGTAVAVGATPVEGGGAVAVASRF